MEADSFNFIVYNNKHIKWARLGQDELQLQLGKYPGALRIQLKRHHYYCYQKSRTLGMVKGLEIVASLACFVPRQLTLCVLLTLAGCQ